MSVFFSLALYSSLLLCTCLFWYWVTKRLRFCNTEERAPLNRSRTEAEAEDEEADTDFLATEIRHLQQPGSFFNPRENPDVGGSSSSSSSGEGSKNKFHVFISHRGPDTKWSFAYHLYDLLLDRGIQAFLDREELQSGESLTEAIKEAIQCCKVNVCILSSGFAESVWCLKELVMMMQKYEMHASILIPVFYDVEPSDVRHLKGAFGQGFQKLISKGKYSGEEIDEWKNALYKIAEISGHQGKGELGMTVVNQICKLLDVGSIATSNKVVGIEQQVASTVSDIMRCRQNGCGVTLVEISGMGGIGKTTFAKELYNKIYHQYDRYCCFIEDVNGLVEKYGVNEIHRQLSSMLFRYDFTKEIRREVKSVLRERLYNAEILVVLDNIHGKIPLSTVFIEDDVPLSPRSIIIVTSRENGVLNHDPLIQRYRQNLIELKISYLDFFTSTQIFCQYAFAGIENVNNEFNELMNKIVAKCHGIPLALTSVGISLYGKDIDSWKYLWNCIKDSLVPDLKEILKFSYNNLATELEKCLFLDVATIFLTEKEELLVALRQQQSDEEDAEFEVRHALNVLKKKDLIHVSSDGDGVLYMHDAFVDLGRSIVKDEDSCPGHRSRVWDPSDVKNMLSHETGTEKVKVLSLVSKGEVVLHEECPWSVDAFSKMSSLQILILHGHCIEGDLSKLSKRLLWLKWTDFPYHKIPWTLCLKHLRILHVSGEHLTHLWEHLPQEGPAKLRQLKLMHCRNLQKLPESMGKLRHISFLDLSDCTSLEIIPDSFGQLYGLKDLRLSGCHALKQLPETCGDLTRLQRLTMMECFALVSLPKSIGKLQGLEALCLWQCHALKLLPETFGGLTSLVDLRIGGCFSLVSLPESIGKLPESIGKLLRLDFIWLYKCTSLEFIPDSFGQLQGLKVLCFHSCPALKRLPETFGGLRSLVDLTIEKCSALVLLPASIGQLLQLYYMNLHKCTSLKFISDSFRQLQGLKFLNLMESPSSKLMPKTFGHLTRFSFLKMPGLLRERLQLTRLDIRIDEHLKGRQQSLQWLTNLCKLNELGCCKKKFSIELLQGVRPPLQGVRPPSNLYLSLTYDDNMELAELQNFEFWKNYSNWNCQVTQQQNHLTWLLREVEVGQVIQINQKRGTAANLLSSEFELIGIYFMESACHLSQEMHTLNVEGFCNLSEVPQSLGNLRHLKRLNLINCYNLQKLPDSVGSLSCLTKLLLIGCLNLEELPDTIGNLQNLTELRISTCLALKGLPSSLGNLHRLKILTVTECWMVEVIHTQALFSLKFLCVRGCVNLRRIIGPLDLSKLENIVIEGCLNLREIMVRRGCFNRLGNLCITGCYRLTFPKGLAEHLRLPSFAPGPLLLSLNYHDMVSESYSETLPIMLKMASCYDHGVLNFKASPALFSAVQEQVRDLVRDLVSNSEHKCVFRKLPDTYGPPIPFSPKRVVCCFISAVYAADLPKHVPLPETTFHLSTTYHNFRPHIFRRSDFGEEIHFAVLRSDDGFLRGRGLVFDFVVSPVKADFVNGRESMHNSYYPSYEALVKEGWLMFVDGGQEEELVVKEICNIFYSQLRKQHLMSHAWTHLPSQLSIHDFSALDIAGCQITKISRHCNTCIMEEETGLTWNRRQCIFKDDHALLLEQRKCSKHSFLPYPVVDGYLEAAAANLYEMSISMLVKGKVVHSRKLQEFSPKTEEEIPYPLNSLLQERASHSTLKTLHKMRLGMLKRHKEKILHYDFRGPPLHYGSFRKKKF